ncbi:hypothetical protein HG1285_12197 [Hydrogenivirga sp. 128-5-R1-1]|nr:hypothetical protein HG1285_12197 [Hydrogenivirga sp. 128-5-R1-1]
MAEKCNVEIETADTRGYLSQNIKYPGLTGKQQKKKKHSILKNLHGKDLKKGLKK